MLNKYYRAGNGAGATKIDIIVILTLVMRIKSQLSPLYILGGAATSSEGFVKKILRVPQAVGLYYSCHAAHASRGTLRKHIIKPMEQVAAPPSIFCFISVSDSSQPSRITSCPLL